MASLKYLFLIIYLFIQLPYYISTIDENYKKKYNTKISKVENIYNIC